MTTNQGRLAPEHQRRIFERFYRADPSEGPKVPGVGLGLSIVEQIVTAHGGQVSVESKVGEGSIFSFTLPLAPPLSLRHTVEEG